MTIEELNALLGTTEKGVDPQAALHPAHAEKTAKRFTSNIYSLQTPRLTLEDPRARTGRDVGDTAGTSPFIVVSIHAPARGATNGVSVARVNVTVSIHAPARGATCS